MLRRYQRSSSYERRSAPAEAILLLHGPLSSRARLEPPVRDRLAALDREPVRAVGQPGFGALHGGQLLEQILPAARVELVLVEVLGVLVAGLESIVGYCLGCKVFAILMRAGIVPEEVCERCNDIWAGRS